MQEQTKQALATYRAAKKKDFESFLVNITEKLRREEAAFQAVYGSAKLVTREVRVNGGKVVQRTTTIENEPDGKLVGHEGLVFNLKAHRVFNEEGVEVLTPALKVLEGTYPEYAASMEAAAEARTATDHLSAVLMVAPSTDLSEILASVHLEMNVLRPQLVAAGLLQPADTADHDAQQMDTEFTEEDLGELPTNGWEYVAVPELQALHDQAETLIELSRLVGQAFPTDWWTRFG